MRRAISLAAVLCLSACSLPQTTVRTGSQAPSLAIRGAPDGAQLFIDGIDSGLASQYDGNPRVLSVLEGTHRVELKRGSEVLYSEKTFVSSGETHYITVSAGASR